MDRLFEFIKVSENWQIPISLYRLSPQFEQMVNEILSFIENTIVNSFSVDIFWENVISFKKQKISIVREILRILFDFLETEV